MGSAQRDEVAHPSGPVQLLNVVPSDQPALRVAYEIDALGRMIPKELLDPLGRDASQFLDRPRVEPAEEPAEVDVMGAVSRPTQSSREPADDARRGEETVQEQDWSLTALQRTQSR